jgi:hypothetical protein
LLPTCGKTSQEKWSAPRLSFLLFPLVLWTIAKGMGWALPSGKAAGRCQVTGPSVIHATRGTPSEAAMSTYQRCRCLILWPRGWTTKTQMPFSLLLSSFPPSSPILRHVCSVCACTPGLQPVSWHQCSSQGRQPRQPAGLTATAEPARSLWPTSQCSPGALPLLPGAMCIA